MTNVFEDANSALAGMFENLQREVSRIENLDATTRSKQQHVDNLTAQETELAARVQAARATLADLERKVIEKMDEHDKAKRDWLAWIAAGRTQVNRLASGQ